MKLFQTLLIINSFFLAFVLSAQDANNPEKLVYAKCDELLSLISVEQGVDVNWQAVNKLFVKDVSLTMVGENGGNKFNFTFDLKRFNAVDAYTKNGFKEVANSRDIWFTPSVAIVKENYTATTLSDGKVEKGINFYTFVLSDEGWLIKSLIWEAY